MSHRGSLIVVVASACGGAAVTSPLLPAADAEVVAPLVTDAGIDTPTTIDAACPCDAGADARIARLSLTTLNILYGFEDEDPGPGLFDQLGERLPLIAHGVGALAPDLAFFQEVALGPNFLYPDVADELIDGMASFGPYTFISGDVSGAAPVVGAVTWSGQATLSRLPILAMDNHSVTMVDTLSPRAVLHTRVGSELGDVDVFNAHLSGPDDQEAATTELEDVVAFVEARAAPGGIAILGGDLNSTEELPVFDVLRRAGFVDVGASCGLICTGGVRTGCTNSHVPLGEPGDRATKRLDYFWLRAAAPVSLSCAPLFGEPFDLGDGDVLWASDHSGVRIEVTRP